jgi:hypothetical protein
LSFLLCLSYFYIASMKLILFYYIFLQFLFLIILCSFPCITFPSELWLHVFFISLAPLVKKVSEERVVEMTNKLCDKLLNGKDQHRDTASIALKTIIAEVTMTSLAEKILVSLAPQLINGVNTVRYI